MRLDPVGARELDAKDPLAKFRDEFVVMALKPCGVTWNSLRDANVRGSHVSFGHPDGLALTAR